MPAELQVVDTLYTRELRILRPKLDSICEYQEDSLVQVAADSMIRLRLEEMEKILNRK